MVVAFNLGRLQPCFIVWQYATGVFLVYFLF